MKLEVGMYVRTKNGMIAKIISKEDVSGSLHREEIVFILDNGNKLAIHSQKVVKASHNIIDLIEEHDYIRIITSAYFEPVYYSYGKLVIRDDIDISKYTNKFIAEVVTKEQFESISYKLGDDK